MSVEGDQESSAGSESESESGDDSRDRSFVWMFRKHLSLESETAWFVLVSALDIWMTYILLSTTDNIVEGNPIAAFFINRWGPAGMVKFKFALVAFVVIAAQIIAQKKPTTARAILIFGTIVVGFVVIYSAVLFVRSG